MTATTALGQREEEARRIARVEGFPIVYAEPDWTFFTLGDDQTVPETEGQWPNVKVIGEKVIRTHFEWVHESQRFEGFVS